jgi:hypothetical protein
VEIHSSSDQFSLVRDGGAVNEYEGRKEKARRAPRRVGCLMKIASACLCGDADVTDGTFVDVGITRVSAPSYPALLRKPLVLIVVLEIADIDKEFEIHVGVKTGDVMTFGCVVDLKNLAYSVRPTEMPAWHVRMVPKDQLQIPSAGSHSIVFVNDGIELYRIRLWAELDHPKNWVVLQHRDARSGVGTDEQRSALI